MGQLYLPHKLLCNLTHGLIVCVCGPGKPYIMGTKRPHKKNNIHF